MSVDPEFVASIRKSALEVALFRARLDCVGPDERERMLVENRRELGTMLDDFAHRGEPISDDELDEWQKHYDAEETDPEVLAITRQAQIDADQEVVRRVRSGSLTSS